METPVKPTRLGPALYNLTVNGAQFAKTSKVQLNGINKATYDISSTQLKARIPKSDLVAAGTRMVKVPNPGPLGGLLNGKTFTIT